MLVVKQNKHCSGCGACKNVCPTESIEMFEDSAGFLYPRINNRTCIKCGKCSKICFANSIGTQENELQLVYGLKAREWEIRKKSSSGGAFFLLARNVLNEGGVVYGASMCDNMRNVKHIRVTSVNQLCMLQGSKYIQSSVGYNYRKCRDDLLAGRRVLFSGTPCQIIGLKKYLSTDYDNLLCVDVICHGVPSPLLWRKYLDYVETRYNGTVRKVSFREKRYNLRMFRITKKRDRICYYESLNDDPYLRLFLSDISLRDSCYDCTAKKHGSFADVTIGDFWGCESVSPKLSDNKGISILICHTKKGKNIFDSIKCDAIWEEEELDSVISFNPSYYKSVDMPKERNRFMEDLRSMDFGDLISMYLTSKESQDRCIKKIIKRTIIYTIYKQIKGRADPYGMFIELSRY